MARFPLVPTAPEPERAILVGVEWRDNAWPVSYTHLTLPTNSIV